MTMLYLLISKQVPYYFSDSNDFKLTMNYMTL